MKTLTCASARRRMQAFHDHELAVADQIAVSAHLQWCDRCAASLAEMSAVRVALQAIAPGRAPLSQEEAAVFTSTVVNRLKAEDDASLVAVVREMFDDMHLVYAGLGAAVATMVSVVIMLGMMRFAPVGHQNASPSASLAAIMTLVATPETSANAIAIDPASHARGTARFQAASETAAEDAVFTLESVVTRQGRLVNLARLKKGQKSTRDEAKAIEDLLQSVARARIEPGWTEGAPLPADGIVWLVTRMTVRASTKAVDVDLPIAPAKGKRVARAADEVRAVRL
jgi:putative zinc finger protein